MLKLYDLPWKITLEETFIRRWLKQNKLYLLYLAKDILSGQGRNGMEEADVCLVSSRGKACGSKSNMESIRGQTLSKTMAICDT